MAASISRVDWRGICVGSEYWLLYVSGVEKACVGARHIQPCLWRTSASKGYVHIVILQLYVELMLPTYAVQCKHTVAGVSITRNITKRTCVHRLYEPVMRGDGSPAVHARPRLWAK